MGFPAKEICLIADDSNFFISSNLSIPEYSQGLNVIKYKISNQVASRTGCM